MTVQYLRKASLIVGTNDDALDLSELRFRFAIRRGDMQTPNTADIRVYNVSDKTADRILGMLPQPEFARVIVQGGYEGNFGVLFRGNLVQVRRGRESATDTYLDITAADGDRAYNYAVTAVSLAAGSTPKDAVQAMLKDMATHGVGEGYISDQMEKRRLPRGKVVFGMTRDALRDLAKNTATNWYIENEQLVVQGKTAYRGGDIPVITSATGMVGLPEQTQNGINVRVLLNPNIKIGQAIKLDNASIQQYRYTLTQGRPQLSNHNTAIQAKLNNDGLYYVMRADHSGDTRGNEWYSDLWCLAIDATLSPEFAVKDQIPLGAWYLAELPKAK